MHKLTEYLFFFGIHATRRIRCEIYGVNSGETELQKWIAFARFEQKNDLNKETLVLRLCSAKHSQL